MAASGRRDQSRSRNQANDVEPIGPAHLAKRATFDTGARKALWGIAKDKLVPKVNTYNYKPFNYNQDIRVLKIFHGPKDGPLECMLFASALPSTEQSRTKTHNYWALSYWWGEPDEEPTHRITMYDEVNVQGETQIQMTPFNSSGTFYVRHNLDAALRIFRSETEDVVIWVDALCINQGKEPEALKEKTAQVARMHEIYSEADYVCIWLGAGKNETAETFEFLRTILDLSKLDDLVKKPETAEKWMLVVNLMKNRWFSRRWVIQELALAKSATVRWGDEKMQWSDFADAIALFMTKHDEIKAILGKRKPTKSDSTTHTGVGALDPRALGANTLVAATSSLFRKSDDGKILQRLVNLEVLVSSLFMVFEASEPRDTVYAVLSLAKDTATRVEPPDPPSWEIPAKAGVLVQVFRRIFEFLSWLFGLGLIFQSAVSVSATSPSSTSKSNPSSPMTPAWPDPCSNPIDDRIAPNYDKSLLDVCADFIEYCVEKSLSLDILCRHWAPRPKGLTRREILVRHRSDHTQEQEQMPSWIPSIEGHAYGGPKGVLGGRRNGDSFVGGLDRQNQQHYNASGGLPPHVEFFKNVPSEETKTAKSQEKVPPPRRQPVARLGTILEGASISTSSTKDKRPPPPPARPNKFTGTIHVKGFRLDVIEKLSGRVLDGVIPAEAFRFGGWDYRHEDLDGRQPSDIPPVPELIWRTLVADRGPDGINAPTWYRRACLECLMYINGSGDLNTSDFSKNPDDTPATMKMFLERVQAVTWCRKFFLTKGKVGRRKTFYGLAPSDTETGDLICILFGCSVPVVLRKIPQTNRHDLERYRFIGECYVHGMMDGEALPTKMPKYPYDTVRGFTIV